MVYRDIDDFFAWWNLQPYHYKDTHDYMIYFDKEQKTYTVRLFDLR